MAKPRATRTNAADSAPGVGDGPAGVAPPPVDSKPGGRRAVWIGVVIVCLIVLVALLVRPLGRRGDTNAGGGAAAQQGAMEPAAPQYGSR